MGLLDGLLGSDMSDPKTMASLQLAAGLMGPGGFGTNLGKGLLGYQGSLSNAQELDAKKQALEMQKLQFAQQTQMYNMQQPLMAEAMRRMQMRWQPQTSAPQVPGQASTMAGQGSQPSWASNNPTMGGTAPAPAPQGQQTMLPGLSDDVALGMIGTGGYSKLPEAIAKANEPTDFVKTLRAANMDPTTPEGQAAIRANIAKSNYVAPVEVKASNLAIDPITREPIAYNPPVEKGVTQTFGKVNGVTTGTGSGALPGYAAAVGGIEKATQAGKESAKVHSIPGPNGTTQTGTGEDLLGIVPPGVPRTGATKTVTSSGTSDTAIQKASADAIVAAPQAVAQSRSAVVGLETALHLVESGTKSGPGTAKAVNALALLNNMGVPLLKGDVDGYQTLQKYLQNSLNQAAAGTTASGSDARFESFMHGQPNAETMNPKALAGAIRYVLSQHDAQIARNEALPQAYSAFQKTLDPNAALSAQEIVNKSIKPDMFNFNRMTPDEQAAYLRQKGAGAKDFVKQYNHYAETTGWVK